MVESHSPEGPSHEGRSPMMDGGGRPVEGRGWEHSQLGRLVAMFHAPQRTFEALSRSPTIAAVLVATLVVSMFGAVVSIWTIDTGSDMGVARTVGLVAGVVAGPPAIAAVLLVTAAIFFVAFLVVGTESSYKSVLSVMLHSWWPATVVGTVLLAVAQWFSRPVDPVAVGTLVQTNLAAFLNEPSPLLYAIALRLDVLQAWKVVLAGIGFAAVLGISRRRSFTVVLVLWVAGTVLAVGFFVGMAMISDRLGISFPLP